MGKARSVHLYKNYILKPSKSSILKPIDNTDDNQTNKTKQCKHAHFALRRDMSRSRPKLGQLINLEKGCREYFVYTNCENNSDNG